MVTGRAMGSIGGSRRTIGPAIAAQRRDIATMSVCATAISAAMKWGVVSAMRRPGPRRPGPHPPRCGHRRIDTVTWAGAAYSVRPRQLPRRPDVRGASPDEPILHQHRLWAPAGRVGGSSGRADPPTAYAG